MKILLLFYIIQILFINSAESNTYIPVNTNCYDIAISKNSLIASNIHYIII